MSVSSFLKELFEKVGAHELFLGRYQSAKAKEDSSFNLEKSSDSASEGEIVEKEGQEWEIIGKDGEDDESKAADKANIDMEPESGSDFEITLTEHQQQILHLLALGVVYDLVSTLEMYEWIFKDELEMIGSVYHNEMRFGEEMAILVGCPLFEESRVILLKAIEFVKDKIAEFGNLKIGN